MAPKQLTSKHTMQPWRNDSECDSKWMPWGASTFAFNRSQSKSTNLFNFYNQVKGHGQQDFKQAKQLNAAAGNFSSRLDATSDAADRKAGR